MSQNKQLEIIIKECINDDNGHNKQEAQKKITIEEMGHFFNKRASGYDDHMRENVTDFNIYYSALSMSIQKTEEKVSILDLGCGTGLELQGVFEKTPNGRITGIDMSEDMMKLLLDRYKDYASQINLITGSYLEYPLGEERFDYAISSMTMHHFVPDEKLELYKKIKKSIKKGGCYIEGDYVVSEEKAKECLNSYYEVVESLDEEQKGLYHIDIPFSMEIQKQLFLKAGFNHVEVIWEKDETAIFVARV